jgi:hypothetical protein
MVVQMAGWKVLPGDCQIAGLQERRSRVLFPLSRPSGAWIFDVEHACSLDPRQIPNGLRHDVWPIAKIIASAGPVPPALHTGR